MPSSVIKAQSSNLTNTNAAVAERSKADHGKKPFIREISFHDKSPLLGVEWHNMDKLRKDPVKKKQGTKSADGCNTVTRNPKAKRRSLLGILRQKSGKYGAVIRDPIRHEQVWLGTFDTAQEASKAYLAKQREFAQLVTVNQACNRSRASAYHMLYEMPSSNSTNASAAVERSKADHGKMPFITEISFRDKRPLLGVEMAKHGDIEKRPFQEKAGLLGIRKQKNGRYGATRLSINKFGWALLTVLKRPNKLICPRKSEFDMLIKGNNENKPKNCDQTLDAASVGRSGKIGSPKTTRIVGVNKNKWGKYTSEIIDPINKKKIWLGTFVTFEEASQAYQSKKLEFQKLVKPKKKCNKKTHPTTREKQIGKEKLVNVNQGHVNCEGFQPESAAEETFHANQYMNSKEAELQRNMPIQEDADLWMGQWVQLPGGKEVNFFAEIGLTNH
ncbi:hypothetical protein K7X08_001371 [Anisodus acutangulus]|uniref:AP2/ERF domain-containing protein n=1 Tax=Anisodus acutangulus TaxID=402998 RepID=A0A9Q1MPM3_9SOLA|nr:hypothetical protein K7X08_001371 [Anisodus acutangulus]